MATKKSTKKEAKAKEPIKIRYKQLRNGNQSIYLDIYENGSRHYEFLKLYLIPETNPKTKDADKEANRVTLEVAKAVKAKRIVEAQNSAHGFSNAKLHTNDNFIVYLRTMEAEFRNNGNKGYADSVRSAINYIVKYKGDKVTFKQVTEHYLLGYIEFLKTTLSRFRKPLSVSSQETYLRVVAIALNRAIKSKKISSNPMHLIDSKVKPKAGDNLREFLEVAEVQMMMDTKCDNECVKVSFLFSCFTGLRISDVRNLTWRKLRTIDGMKQVEGLQQKTKSVFYVPLSENALQLIPDRGDAKLDDKIFPLPHPSTVKKHIDRWAERAGINKHVTYHVSRHTNATMLLTYDKDIAVVRDILGHKSVKTTERYAKIISDRKKEAVNSIPSLTKADN
ncbi:MAG: site-specific integrase [Rikenellaceae bacterium]